MKNILIDEECSKLRQHESDINIEQLKTSLDLFVSVLKETEIFDIKYVLIDQIISTLISLSNVTRKLAQSELITHTFFIISRDTVIVEYLHRKSTEDNIKQEHFSNAIGLLQNVCYNIRNDKNIIEIKHLLIHKSLIDELGNCLKDIGISGKYLNDSLFINSIHCLLKSFKYCWKHRLTNNEYALITPVLFGIIECLSSSYTVDLIKSLESNFTQTLNTNQILFLDTMPWYLQWYSDQCEPECFIKIVRMLLNKFTTWLTSCDPQSYLQCSTQMGTMIRHLNTFLVRPPIELDNLNLLSEEFYDDYCKLVSYWSTVLSFTLSYPQDKLDINLTIRFIVQNLYNFTLHLKILNFMKTIPNLVSILLKITDVEYEEIQLNIYRCLGKIMIEKDIKTMANPDKIAAVYIEFITNTIDDRKKEQRFYSLLESLKNFVQHDQVKTELIQQNALPLLVRCVEETRLDPIKGHQTTLEILLALSFNNDACLILKQNTNFINHIRILANSNKPGLQRVIEMLLWKLEKEEEAIAKPTTLNSYKYDIMISYSHRNQEICFDIHEQLVKDGFRVWIDRDCLRGSTMIGIANAIENSESVLICMSSMYKQSVYCQSEAHYAYERGCRLVPIIIEQDYKPDGWLGIIVSGKIYVDFMNEEFNLSCQKLNNEIRGLGYRNLSQLSIKSEGEFQLNTSLLTPQRFQSINESVIDLPDYITEWTNEHVKSFFHRIGLSYTLLPLCTNMNGYQLVDFYEICLINRESMFQSLKFEMNEKHHVLLPIADYITFLHEMKSYVPMTNAIVKSSGSSFFSLTICNIL